MVDRVLPSFKTDDEYREHVEACLRDGARPWPPTTVSQLELGFEICPEYAKHWLPYDSIRKAFQIPNHIGRQPLQFSEDWQERFLVTLSDDSDFRLAVRHLLGGVA